MGYHHYTSHEHHLYLLALDPLFRAIVHNRMSD